MKPRLTHTHLPLFFSSSESASAGKTSEEISVFFIKTKSAAGGQNSVQVSLGRPVRTVLMQTLSSSYQSVWCALGYKFHRAVSMQLGVSEKAKLK